MAGPIRRLRAASKIPSPKATVQTIVANDPEHNVSLVRLVFTRIGGPAPLSKTLELKPAGLNRARGDSWFAASLEFADCAVECDYQVELTMLDKSGKAIGKPTTFTLTVESTAELEALMARETIERRKASVIPFPLLSSEL